MRWFVGPTLIRNTMTAEEVEESGRCAVLRYFATIDEQLLLEEVVMCKVKWTKVCRSEGGGAFIHKVVFEITHDKD